MQVPRVVQRASGADVRGSERDLRGRGGLRVVARGRERIFQPNTWRVRTENVSEGMPRAVRNAPRIARTNRRGCKPWNVVAVCDASKRTEAGMSREHPQGCLITKRQSNRPCCSAKNGKCEWFGELSGRSFASKRKARRICALVRLATCDTLATSFVRDVRETDLVFQDVNGKGMHKA